MFGLAVCLLTVDFKCRELVLATDGVAALPEEVARLILTTRKGQVKWTVTAPFLSWEL